MELRGEQIEYVIYDEAEKIEILKRHEKLEYGRYEIKGQLEMKASEEYERQIALEMLRAPVTRQRQVSQKAVDKRRKAAKLARKQRKRK